MESDAPQYRHLRANLCYIRHSTDDWRNLTEAFLLKFVANKTRSSVHGEVFPLSPAAARAPSGERPQSALGSAASLSI
jgi:hypothetical protein